VQEDRTQRLRYSVLPGQMLRVPAVRVWQAELRDECIWYHTYCGRGDDPNRKYEHSRLVEPPDELYLRELTELDLTDETALLDFVNQYGRLGDPGETLPPDADETRSLLPSWLRMGVDHYGDSGYDSAKLTTKRNADGYQIQTLFSVQTHARCLRDGVRLWQVITGQTPLSEMHGAWELPPVSLDKQEPFYAPPADADGALVLLRDILNAGLQTMQARLIIHEPGAEPPGSEVLTNLYSALCLQLFNHIVEDAVYIRCHNETCNRLFVRQRGRAKQGKYHTTGVMYCSDYCARAQGQRELRRRKAKAPLKSPYRV
jgi:hypothetical protein